MACEQRTSSAFQAKKKTDNSSLYKNYLPAYSQAGSKSYLLSICPLNFSISIILSILSAKSIFF